MQAFIGPVPTFDAGAIQPEHIAHADDLLRYMEDEDTTLAAFLRWAEDRRTAADRREALQQFDTKALDDARAHVTTVLTSGAGIMRQRLQLCAQSAQVFIEQGLTFRQTASFCGLPLREIVMMHLGIGAAATCELLADLEEALLDGALEREKVDALTRRLGMGVNRHRAVRSLCALHRINPAPCRDAA